MSPLRRSNIVATLLQLAGIWRRAKRLSVGPGCTCESCVQAWDRHQPARTSKPARDPRRHLRPGLD
jgi:hypothetical protein